MIGPDPHPTAPADTAPPGAAEHTAASAAPPDVQVFQGDSAFGPVSLALERAPGAEGLASGAEQVLQLAQAEALIQAVEQWLRAPWDPAPLAYDADVAAATTTAGYRAVVRDPALSVPGSVLTVPLGALHLPPPEALRAPALAWSAQEAVVVLGEVPADALAQLQVGGMVWLPASLASAWEVQLVDPAGRLSPCAARLELAARRISVPPLGAVRGAPTDGAALQVVLTRAVQLPLDHWLGWGRAGAPYHWPAPQPWAAELRQGATVLARGALMPLGEGCGLYVESLEAAPLAA